MAACGTDPALRRATADGIASAGEMVRHDVAAGRFLLAGYERRRAGRPDRLVVYVEGDGRSWLGRRQLTDDPTPTDPIALRLAAADPSPAVLYLARPCQYAGARLGAECGPEYWAHRRFAPEIVDAYGEVIRTAAARAGVDEIELVGFSGGGVIATLLARRQAGVALLVTVAAPLEVGAWVRHHRLTPLQGSLDPGDHPVPAVPQAHLAGGQDTTVPAALIAAYAGRAPPGAPVRFELVPAFDHGCCWHDGWAARIERLRRELTGARFSSAVESESRPAAR